MKDKEYLQMLKLFSKYFKNLYITSVRSPRAATLQEIKKADFFKQNTAFFPIASQALQEACRHNRIVFVSGSFYLVASLRTRVGARKDWHSSSIVVKFIIYCFFGAKNYG